MQSFISNLTNKEYPIYERVVGKTIRKTILDLIKKEHPNFSDDQFLSLSELNQYREKYIEEYVVKQLGDLSELEQTVLNSVTDKTTLIDKIDSEDQTVTTFGQKVADNVATFGGSWTFIISFGVFLAIWIILNFVWLQNKGFDPYPFILLNLILSCIAAMQAPIIMMSQNRQEEKDRERARKDYMINLKSELEIRVLHEKIDHLIMHQQQELLEIQKVQIDMMNDIMNKMNTKE